MLKETNPENANEGERMWRNSEPRRTGSLPWCGQWLSWVSCNSQHLKRMAAWMGRWHPLLFYNPVHRAPFWDSHQKMVPFYATSYLIKCHITAPKALPCGSQWLLFDQPKRGRQLNTNPSLCSVEERIPVPIPQGEAVEM